jgi:uridine nucleosidase
LDQALKGNAVLGIAEALQALAPGEKLDLVATGSLTNVALFAKVFPQLLLDKVERIIAMSGAEGRGNKSPVAESNVLCDAHAAQIVFDLNLPVIICVSSVSSRSALFSLADNFNRSCAASQSHAYSALHSRHPSFSPPWSS